MNEDGAARRGQLESKLPPMAQQLLGVLREGVHSTVERVTLDIVRSPQFEFAPCERHRPR